MEEKRRLQRRQSSAGSGSGLSSNLNISRLARAISTKGLKLNESHSGKLPSLEMLIEESGPALDSNKLIQTFDAKLSLIQKLLKEYQNEGKQRPDGGKRQKKIADHVASVSGEAKGKNKKFTEEEAYMNEKIERRVRNAGAGASRALSERVHLYRTNALARAELQERCIAHLKIKEEADAKMAAECARAHDFIRKNRTCLQGETGMRSQEGIRTVSIFGQPLRPSTAPQMRARLSAQGKPRAMSAHPGPFAPCGTSHSTSVVQLPASLQLVGHSIAGHTVRPSTTMSYLHREGGNFMNPTPHLAEATSVFGAQGLNTEDSELDLSCVSEEGEDGTADVNWRDGAQCTASGKHPLNPPSNATVVKTPNFQRLFPTPPSPVPPSLLLSPPKPSAVAHQVQIPQHALPEPLYTAEAARAMPAPYQSNDPHQLHHQPHHFDQQTLSSDEFLSRTLGHASSGWLKPISTGRSPVRIDSTQPSPLPLTRSLHAIPHDQHVQQQPPPFSRSASRARTLSTSPTRLAQSNNPLQAPAPNSTRSNQGLTPRFQDELEDAPSQLQALAAGQQSPSSTTLSRIMTKLRNASVLHSRASPTASGAESSPNEDDGNNDGNRSLLGPSDGCRMSSCTEPQTGATPELTEAERELRLLLTSRPGGGGSPTKRRRFNKQYKLLVEKRAKQLTKARLRKEDLDEAKMNRSAQEAKLKAEAQAFERRMKEQAQQKLELIQRHRTWLGTCNLASKLWYIADCIKKDREVHPIRELRRRAAVTIAGWYKDVLQKRKWMQLVRLQAKMQRVLAPYLAAKQAQVRQRCGERILHFCSLSQKGAAESAVIAVKRYRGKLITIQRAWRISLAVWAMQNSVLYNHLSKFEKFVLAKAQRDLDFTEAAGRQHVRRFTTMNKMPVWQSKPESASMVRRESTVGQSKKSRRGEVDDPVIEAALSTHLQPIPKDIKQQIVLEALRECRKRFHYQMVAFMSDKATYLAQKPIDDLRQALLKDSGLQAPPELVEPQRPIMLVLLPRAQLKAILFRGIEINNARKAHYEAERRAQAETAWMQLQEAKAKEAKLKARR